MSKKRYRRRKPKFKLWSAKNLLGHSSVQRLISFEDGMELVTLRKAERVYLGDTDIVDGFRLVTAKATRGQVIVVVPPVPSSTAFSKREHEAIVGLRGKSRTRGLTKEARMQRVAEGLPGIDDIELALDKFENYQTVH